VSEDTFAVPGDFTAGSQIAGYRLEEQIGSGGMAVVFRAYDARLDRHVALKILAPGLARDDAFRQRFIRESRAAAAVDDPHIIPVFEAGEASGVLFIAMRFVRGGDVRTLLDQEGPLPPARAVEIISQVASALDSAHARGLVHRDVKPGNMLLDAGHGSDRPDHVYLSDFGLSKASLAVSGLTGTGQFLGTLDYVAPEQIEGRRIDGRVDQYALACAAFELLSGAPPFSRDQGIAVMYAQLSELPPPLTSRRQGLPGRVDQVLGKALAKAPADRYQSCREFAAALREAIGTGSVQPAGPGPAGPPTQVAMPVPPPGPAQPEGTRRPEPLRPEPVQHGLVQPEPTWSEAAQSGPAQSQPPQSQPPGSGAAQSGPGQSGPGQSGPGQSGPGQSQPAQSGPAQAQPAQAQPRQPGEPLAGPPTQAAGFPAVRSTDPGLAALPGGPSGPAGSSRPPGYGPSGPEIGPGPSGAERPSRPWWRSPLPIAALCAALVVVIGGGAYLLAGHGGGSTGTGHAGGAGTVLTAPACTTAVAHAKLLSHVTSQSVATGGKPFGVTVARDGRYTFVSAGSDIEMLSNGSAPAPAPVSTISVAGLVPGGVKDVTTTHDGQYLVAAAGDGAVVLNVADAEHGATSPVTGVLTSSAGAKAGAIGVDISPDDHYVFVTLQAAGKVAVFNLQEALDSGFGPADFVGYIPVPDEPTGIVGSPDGRWLYVAGLQRSSSDQHGTLSVVSLAGAETDPAKAVAATVAAGCGADRVTISADGTVVWVTARFSNALLAFSAARLRTDPSGALLAMVRVGEDPIGLTLADGGARMVVADSDDSNVRGESASLAVVSTTAALAGKPALLGYISSGLLPRVLTVEDGKTLLVTNYNSRTLQAVTLADLP
jgi:serine/threonine protein kinase/6-phosphogluconolactonase (cycloisomerase 2 family)